MDQSKHKGHAPSESPKAAATADGAAAKKGPAKAGATGKPENVNDFPRMLHKGVDRMVVKSEEELKSAQGDGWDFHHDPPAKDDDNLDLGDLPASTAVSRVGEMNDLSALETLRNQEVGRPKMPEERANVLRAIDLRIAKLKAVHQPKPATAVSQEPVPAAGESAVKAEIADATDVATLKALREAEVNSPGGGRTDVLNAIAARIEELAG